MTDSSTGGYLLAQDPPVDGEELVDILQSVIVGVTGMDPSLVRPRWQQRPPTHPTIDESWCAIGILERVPFDYPQQTFVENKGVTLHHQEQINALASFFGKDAALNASLFRSGLQINQNLEALGKSGIKLRSIDPTTHVPELVNAQYIDRVDVPMNFMRMWEALYDVLTVISVPFTQNIDTPPIVNECVTPKE